MQAHSLLKSAAGQIVIFGCVLAFWTQPSRGAEGYVVITNQANPTASVSSSDLKKMFLGDKTNWPNGAKVTAVTPAAESPEYGVAIKRATGMSAGDFKRYILQMSFVGKSVTLPRSFETSAAVARFVSATPGAVGCVPATDAAAGVKVLRVD